MKRITIRSATGIHTFRADDFEAVDDTVIIVRYPAGKPPQKYGYVREVESVEVIDETPAADLPESIDQGAYTVPGEVEE